jgi:hypothetical protein
MSESGCALWQLKMVHIKQSDSTPLYPGEGRGEFGSNSTTSFHFRNDIGFDESVLCDFKTREMATGFVLWLAKLVALNQPADGTCPFESCLGLCQRSHQESNDNKAYMHTGLFELLVFYELMCLCTAFAHQF